MTISDVFFFLSIFMSSIFREYKTVRKETNVFTTFVETILKKKNTDGFYKAASKGKLAS